ncbi:TrmH family RNA methyltransferase [Helicobacter sp. 23-1044]
MRKNDSSLRGARAKRVQRSNPNESKIDCHDSASQNLAMTNKKSAKSRNDKIDLRESHTKNTFIIYGKQPCLFVLENHSDLIKEIYFGKDIDRAIFARFARLQKPIIRADFKKMQSLAKGGNHQGFILRVEQGESTQKKFSDFSKILVLVGISDVGNIGAIFRNSLAFGVECIISTNALNLSGVARSSSGAFFGVPHIIYKDYLSLANELKMAHFSLFGADMSGENLASNFAIPQKWALFLGSEGEGLPKRLLGRMDLNLGIKMQNFDSLNVSVAAGILLYELTK